MITDEMHEQITKKEALNKKLTELVHQQVALEIKEANKRANLMNSDLSKVIDGKITEKAKVAYCDTVLKHEVNQIKHLKKDVATVKREIELVNDKISLVKYMIRELEITSN